MTDFGYKYDGIYILNGMAYEIFNNTSSQKYVFVIAWIKNLTNENDVQTWFGEEPTEEESPFFAMFFWIVYGFVFFYGFQEVLMNTFSLPE